MPVQRWGSERVTLICSWYCHLNCHHLHSVRTCSTKGLCYLYKTLMCKNSKATSYLFTAETQPVTLNIEYEHHKPSQNSAFPCFWIWKVKLISACHSVTNTATDCRPETQTNCVSSKEPHVYKSEGYIIFIHSRHNACRVSRIAMYTILC
jgi:hypothetical protein